MSFDDYAQHLAQKYRLAISIAILNIKPTNLTIDEFLHQIRTTVNKNTDIDDLNITACSDDFNIDSSDEMNQMNQHNMNQSHDHTYFLNENHMNQKESHAFKDQSYMNQNRCDSYLCENNVHNKDIEGIIVLECEDEMKIDDEVQISDSNGTRNNEEIQGNVQTQATNDIDINASNVLTNLKESDLTNIQRREKFRELIKVLKGNDITTDKLVKNNSQPIYPISIQTEFDSIGLTQCSDNYCVTESNTLNTVDKEFQQNRQSEHETQRIQQTALKDKDNLNNTQVLTHEKEIKNGQRRKTRNELADSVITKNHFHYKEIISNSNENDSILKNIEKSRDFDINMGDNTNILNDYNNINNKTSTNNGQRHIPVELIDTQETIIYTDTQYSPSQVNEVTINTQFIHGNKYTKDIVSNKSNNEELNSKTQISHKNPANLIKTKEKCFVNQNHTNNEINKNIIEQKLQENVRKVQNERNIIEKDTALQNMDLDVIESSKDTAFENCTIDKTINRNTCILATGSTVFDKTSDVETELTGEEKIPFKIIEEMNRIKIYLRRKENRDSSGYRSTQSTSSFGGTPQYLWLGQSASTIFNYLTNCLLLTSTQHLTEQISEILGQLIDRLYEDETYPGFLEDILTTVDKTLQLLYEEDNYVFDVLQKKDEQMQRILLLNKSTHVQKFTIEKINNILQNLLDTLTVDDTTMEIQNINKIENLCYIFQILEVLLPKYSLNSQNSTQNSQDDKILRKKDITDIWRKKWIEKKIETNEGSFENKCVFKDCSDVLNKIIINLMDGYALIAFSALKCFNVMHT